MTSKRFLVKSGIILTISIIIYLLAILAPLNQVSADTPSNTYATPQTFNGYGYTFTTLNSGSTESAFPGYYVYPYDSQQVNRRYLYSFSADDNPIFLVNNSSRVFIQTNGAPILEDYNNGYFWNKDNGTYTTYINYPQAQEVKLINNYNTYSTLGIATTTNMLSVESYLLITYMKISGDNYVTTNTQLVNIGVSRSLIDTSNNIVTIYNHSSDNNYYNNLISGGYNSALGTTLFTISFVYYCTFSEDISSALTLTNTINGYDSSYYNNYYYNTGYDTGEQVGYADGFNDGESQSTLYQNGYNTGYQAGIDSNTMTFTSFFRNLFTSIGTIFNIEVFGGITIGTILLIPCIFGLIWFFIKFFGG